LKKQAAAIVGSELLTSEKLFEAEQLLLFMPEHGQLFSSVAAASYPQWGLLPSAGLGALARFTLKSALIAR